MINLVVRINSRDILVRDIRLWGDSVCHFDHVYLALCGNLLYASAFDSISVSYPSSIVVTLGWSLISLDLESAKALDDREGLGITEEGRRLYAKFIRVNQWEELGSTYDNIRDMIILRIGSVKDKILATSSETSKVDNVFRNKCCVTWTNKWEKRADDEKERVKPRRVRAMAMTIKYRVRVMILTAQSEAFKSPVLWVEIGESSLTGLELVQETSDKFEVGDRVLLKVSPWKGVIRFGKKGKLAPRYVGPFEILERIGPVAYRLRLPEELSGVHDTFHVSNLKKCLADASLHVPLDEIKVDKTLRFVEEPVEIMDREVKSLTPDNR
ncbi:hypothetical protein Tco_0506628 [Tanacetum coccineum]